MTKAIQALVVALFSYAFMQLFHIKSNAATAISIILGLILYISTESISWIDKTAAKITALEEFKTDFEKFKSDQLVRNATFATVNHVISSQVSDTVQTSDVEPAEGYATEDTDPAGDSIQPEGTNALNNKEKRGENNGADR